MTSSTSYCLYDNKDPWNLCESDDMQILSNVCNEINYHWHMCRITTGAFIQIQKVTNLRLLYSLLFKIKC